MIDLVVMQDDLDLLKKTVEGKRLLARYEKSLNDLVVVIKEIQKYASKRRDNSETGGIVLSAYKW